MAELPPKTYFRIGEVADLVGVEPHVLRYWEREFRAIRPTKSAKGQRVYSRKDVENLLRVRDLLYRDGFTIAGARKQLHAGGEPAPQEPALEMPVETAASSSPALPSASAAPELLPPAAPSVREQLLALRREVEDFLGELANAQR